jgi:hypothetical protein
MWSVNCVLDIEVMLTVIVAPAVAPVLATENVVAAPPKTNVPAEYEFEFENHVALNPATAVPLPLYVMSICPVRMPELG